MPAAPVTVADFNRLMDELLRTGLKRSVYRPWEIDILLEVEACPLAGQEKCTALGQYQNAVQAALEQGATRPMKFSEFLTAHEATPLRRTPSKSTRTPVPRRAVH